MRANRRQGTLMAVLVVLGGACSSDAQDSAGIGGRSASASGGASAGTSGGVMAAGSKASSGGQSAASFPNTSQALGGATGSGGKSSDGTSGKGGASATGAGGSSKAGGSGSGGLGGSERTGIDAGGPATGGAGSGGQTGAGGAGNSGTTFPDAGAKDAAGSEAGTGGGTGAFDPCPATGACKILPLGDSITFGVNYDGGYRVKLFSDAIADKKDITYVGKLSNGPSSVAGTTFPQNNEGHNGWTIQQLDDIVTGKSTDANYSGKKLMADLAPHIVLLHAGTNDTSRSPTGMPDRLGTLIDHILADGPNVLLVVTTIVPIKQGSYGNVGETYNNAVPGVVQKRIDAGKHVILVDMFKDFPSAGLGKDGVHPNQQGYDWMAGIWYDAIKSYLR